MDELLLTRITIGVLRPAPNTVLVCVKPIMLLVIKKKKPDGHFGNKTSVLVRGGVTENEEFVNKGASPAAARSLSQALGAGSLDMTGEMGL